MAVNRKAILNALQERLRQKVTLARDVTTRDIGAAQWAQEQQPLVVLRPEEQIPDITLGCPTVWRIHVDLILYCKASGTNGSRDVLLEMIDQVAAALTWQPGELPGDAGMAETTLGGLVRRTYIYEPIAFEAGEANSGQGWAGIPVELVAV